MPVALLLLCAAALAADDKTPVPRAPNLRVVDFGADLGGGTYRGQTAHRFAGVEVDVDGDGDTKDDSVSGWEFSLDEPLNPRSAIYDSEAPSARFYGGLVGFHANQPKALLTEGMLNENHELRDDCNLMSNQGSDARKAGNALRAYGLWFWRKDDFLNGGAGHAVTFDDASLLAVHVSRYWDDVEGGRWVVRDGADFYISEEAFGTAEAIAARGAKTHVTWTLHPRATRWAPYRPSAPAGIAFATQDAAFAAHEFRDVTAVGFYVFKDSLTPGVVAVKWYAFECYARVANPDAPSLRLAMAPVPGADGKPSSLLMGTTEVPYARWREVRDWAVSNQYCAGLDQRGYAMDREGDMGSMGPLRPADGAVCAAAEPATNMTWLDAVAWCNALSELEGRTPCYYADEKRAEVLRVVRNRLKPDNAAWRPRVYLKGDADGFRLPTLGEWARAAAGAAADKEHAWLGANAQSRTHAVGTLQPTAAGFYDLIGNVWEFVWDVPGDFCDPAERPAHTVLGGGFTSDRFGQPDAYPAPYGGASPAVGLRVVRGAPPVLAQAPLPAEVPQWQMPAAAPARPAEATAPRAFGQGDLVKVAQGAYLRDDEAQVTVSDFLMGQTEVDYARWRRVVDYARGAGYEFDYSGSMGSMNWRTGEFEHTPGEPVTDVGWFDAIVWCNAASRMDGLTPVYYEDEAKTKPLQSALAWRIRMVAAEDDPRGMVMDREVYTKWDADGYRLPTWAEWTVARRDGARGAMTPELAKTLADRDAAGEWLAANSEGHTHPAASGKPNALGLYGLGGNVAEWLHDNPVDDYYRAENPVGEQKDGLFGVSAAGGHFRGESPDLGRGPLRNRKSAAWPWLGFRVVRYEAGARTDKPFEPKVVLDVKAEDLDALQGRTFRGNNGRTGWLGDTPGPAATPSVLWKVATGGEVIASPVVVDGTVYVGSRGKTFYALDAKSGDVKWKFATEGEIEGSATVDRAGTVYIGSRDGWLYALRAADGGQVWRYSPKPAKPADMPVIGSPAVAYGTVFAAFGSWGGYYAGVDAQKGQPVWRIRRFKPNEGLTAPTIVGTRFLAPMNDNLLFTFDVRTELPLVQTLGHHSQAPVAAGDGIVAYQCGPSDHLYASETMKRLHEKTHPGGGLSFFPQSGPALHGGRAWFAKENVALTCYTVADGTAKVAWTQPLPARVRSSVTVAGGAIYYGCDDGNIYARNGETGTELWRFATGGPVGSTPWVAGGTLFVGSDDGNVYALR